MPVNSQYGYIFTKASHTEEQISRAIAHELGHGAFHLWHTFSAENKYVASQGATTNLMDYNGTSTDLYKYQWDYIHNPESVLFRGDDEEGEYLLKNHLLLINTIRQSNKRGEKILDLSEFSNIQDYMQSAELHDNGYNLTIPELDCRTTESSSIKINPSQIFTEIVTVDGKSNVVLYFNLLETVANPIGIEGTSERAVEFVVKPEFADELKTYLLLLPSDESADEPCEYSSEDKNASEIVIKYTRKERNDYRTWGEFEIVGEDYSGYVLEREKGSNPTAIESNKRIPAGTYELIYSEEAGGNRTEFYNVTLCIKEHTGYKLHGGNRADQSKGCLLINDFSPQTDSYPDAFQYKIENGKLVNKTSSDKKSKVANTYYGHQDPMNPAYKLRNKVYELETEIKKMLKTDAVKKILIIDESKEIVK